MIIVLTSHSTFCEGLANSCQMITGITKGIYSVPLDEAGVTDFRKRLGELLDEQLKQKHDILIFTDIKGGTPYNESLTYFLKHEDRIRIISGMNLPSLIEAALSFQTVNSIESLASSVLLATKDSLELTTNDQFSEDDDEEILF